MTHQSVTEHTFKCDDEDCRNRIHVTLRSKHASEKRLRRETGWSIPYHGVHKCPEHNTKEPVDEDDYPYYIHTKREKKPIY